MKRSYRKNMQVYDKKLYIAGNIESMNGDGSFVVAYGYFKIWYNQHGFLLTMDANMRAEDTGKKDENNKPIIVYKAVGYYAKNLDWNYEEKGRTRLRRLKNGLDMEVYEKYKNYETRLEIVN